MRNVSLGYMVIALLRFIIVLIDGGTALVVLTVVNVVIDEAPYAPGQRCAGASSISRF